MSAPRFHVSSGLKAGVAEVELPAAAAHHALRVLRLRAGDTVVLFDGHGIESAGQLLAGGGGAVRVRLTGPAMPASESPVRVELAQALCPAEKMDLVVQKATELGAAVIHPVTTRRSVARLEGERATRRREHWQRLAVAACEQCGRGRIPEVSPVTDFPNWLAALPAAEPGDLRLVLAPAAASRLRDLQPASRVVLIVGPEGGLAEGELEAARSRGFAPIALGPRILRTETAGLAALAAIQALWGDL